MPIPVGIDLGTTNSAISVYRRGRVETLKIDGQVTMPSAVCFRDKRTVLAGIQARNLAMVRPDSTVLSVKRRMGDRNFTYSIHDKVYTPVQISAMIMEKLCEGHETTLGGAPTDAVITVPAYFTDEQRRDTKLAGEAAGLNVLRLLPEPTAAAIALGLDRGRNQTILIYDLGGGTFDVSILKVQNNDFQVQAVGGDHDLGGNDFDQLLLEHAIEIFHTQQGIDLRRMCNSDPEVRQAKQLLSTACENIKIELADADEAYLDLPSFFRGKHLATSITRDTFESLIRPLIYRTKDVVLQTIRDAGLGVEDIDRLVLVGGSTKIPMVRRVLAETVKEPYVADHVDLAVSHGAAIMAANLHALTVNGQSSPDFAPVEIKVTDVCAHPISIGLLNEFDEMEAVTVIKKNQSLKAAGTALGFVDPGQLSSTVPVFRGNDPAIESNTFLGTLKLTYEPSDVRTYTRFELILDESGLLLVEGSILDLEGRHEDELCYLDPAKLRVARKVRAEIKLPD